MVLFVKFCVARVTHIMPVNNTSKSSITHTIMEWPYFRS